VRWSGWSGFAGVVVDRAVTAGALTFAAPSRLSGMKLAGLAVIAGLAGVVLAPSLARADVLSPPGGPVYVDDGPPRADRGMPRPGPIAGARRGMRDPRAIARRQQIRRALLAGFDANHDGRLGPRERVRAIRALRRIERRLAAPLAQAMARQGMRGKARRANRDRMYRRFMQRYDVNRDGRVGPREVPRGAADRLRRFDRDGDGWVDRDELP
jgi:hypothetical protein